MKKLRHFFQKLYRVSFSPEKQEETVWKDLKSLHADLNHNSGIYENQRSIKTVLELANDVSADFLYQVVESHFLCQSCVLDSYDPELTSEIFILATHFNNLLNIGRVTVDVDERSVQFQIKQEITLFLLYPGELFQQMERHQKIAKDVYQSYLRLVEEGEEPAIIIADLMKQHQESKSAG